MKPTFDLIPVNGLITVTAGYTPTANIHEPDSTYCRYMWLNQVGPTSYLAWSHLTAWLPDDDTAAVAINYVELAYGLGTAPGRLHRALARLVGFHLAYTDPADTNTLHVKRRAPQLNPKQLVRLAERCPTLAACHDELLHTAA